MTEAAAKSDLAQLTAMVNVLQTQVKELRKNAAPTSTPTVVGSFIKPRKPELYKGEQQVLAWCFKLERYFHATNTTSEVDKCNLASTLMDGVAANWLRCLFLEAEADITRPLPATWKEFKGLLIKQFQPMADEDEARQKLMRLTHRTTVRSYVQLFLDTAMRLPDMHEKDKLFRFKEGLKLDAREWVTRCRPATLLDAMTAAEEWDSIRLGERARDNMAKYRSAQSKPVQSEATPMQVDNARLVEGDSGERRQGPRRETRTCFNCNKPGHLARDCPKKTVNGAAAKVHFAEAEDAEHTEGEEDEDEENC